MARTSDVKLVLERRSERKWLAFTTIVLIASLCAPRFSGSSQAFDSSSEFRPNFAGPGFSQQVAPVISMTSLDLRRLSPASFGDTE
jgi:hypothetical protein